MTESTSSSEGSKVQTIPTCVKHFPGHGFHHKNALAEDEYGPQHGAEQQLCGLSELTIGGRAVVSCVSANCRDVESRRLAAGAAEEGRTKDLAGGAWRQKMAGVTGLEPATPRSTVWYSNQIELHPRAKTQNPNAEFRVSPKRTRRTVYYSAEIGLSRGKSSLTAVSSAPVRLFLSCSFLVEQQEYGAGDEYGGVGSDDHPDEHGEREVAYGLASKNKQ